VEHEGAATLLGVASGGLMIETRARDAIGAAKRCADKAPRRSHDFDAAGRESRLSFLN
jgi:hypothetical protein